VRPLRADEPPAVAAEPFLVAAPTVEDEGGRAGSGASDAAPALDVPPAPPREVGADDARTVEEEAAASAPRRDDPARVGGSDSDEFGFDSTRVSFA
jgi:hypothetical protein